MNFTCFIYLKFFHLTFAFAKLHVYSLRSICAVSLCSVLSIAISFYPSLTNRISFIALKYFQFVKRYFNPSAPFNFWALRHCLFLLYGCYATDLNLIENIWH